MFPFVTQLGTVSWQDNNKLLNNLNNQLYMQPVCSTNVTNPATCFGNCAVPKIVVSKVCGTYRVHVKFVMQINCYTNHGT